MWNVKPVCAFDELIVPATVSVALRGAVPPLLPIPTYPFVPTMSPSVPPAVSLTWKLIPGVDLTI